MSDYQLGSTWSEVDIAAATIKNGVQKSNLSSGVQASLNKADTALQEHQSLDGVVPRNQQIAKTSSYTQQVAIDSNGKLWSLPGGGGGGGTTVYTITISESDGTYTSDTYHSGIQTLINGGGVVQASTPEGIAYYNGIDNSASSFCVYTLIGDALNVVQYRVGSSAVYREVFPVDNAAIGLPLKTNSDVGKAILVGSGSSWVTGYVVPVSATITQEGTTYVAPSGTFTKFSDAVSNGREVVAYTPDGLARFSGVNGTSLVLLALNDVADVWSAVVYLISGGDSVTRTVYPLDNASITPAGIGAAPAVVVETVTGPTPSITPVANHSYVCGEVASIQITANFAAIGDWSVEFNTPQNVDCSVDLPSALKIATGAPSTFARAKHYEINTHNGYAVIGEW